MKIVYNIFFIAINIPDDETLKVSSLVLGQVWKREQAKTFTGLIVFSLILKCKQIEVQSDKQVKISCGDFSLVVLNLNILSSIR